MSIEAESLLIDLDLPNTAGPVHRRDIAEDVCRTACNAAPSTLRAACAGLGCGNIWDGKWGQNLANESCGRDF